MHKTIESHLWALGVYIWLLVVIFMNLSVYSGPLTKSRFKSSGNRVVDFGLWESILSAIRF